MFAPPPVQLSRSEIERRKRRQSAGGDAAAARSSIGSDPTSPPTSLHRTESSTSKDAVGSPPSSGRKGGGWLFGRAGEKAVTSSPPLPGSPPEPPKQHPGDRAASKVSAEKEKPKTLSEAFGEHPRKASAPPKRPPRPPSDIPLLPGSFAVAPLPATPPPQRPVPLTPAHSEIPPPVPDKSPKRLDGKRQSGSVDSTGITSARRTSTISPKKGGALSSKVSRRRSGSFNGKIEKSAASSGRRASAAANVRAAVSDMGHMRAADPPRPPRRATDSELHSRPGPIPLSAAEEFSWKRRQKGETMSMLLNDGFFPAQEYIFSNKNPNISVQVPFPPPLSLLNKELPDTPSSIVPTPTELYQSSPVRTTRPVTQQRKKGPKRRSPLAPLSVNDAKTNTSTRPPALGLEADLSPSRLSAIPEGSTMSENTPPGSASGMSTPLATKIHLRGGSVITLSPPELTAWKHTYYLQGPIKLPKPTIMPRKGSTASMDAFQEVVDHVYQEALNIPRRRSDDQVFDDICEFFDDFAFPELGFEGDVLGVLDLKLDDMEDVPEEMEEMGAEIERFATPPHEIDPSPVEKVIAKEIVEHTIMLPPVETEETLRARDIARLSGGAPPSPTTSSRRASTTSRKDSTALPLLPVPETTMLDLPPPLPIAASKSREDVRVQERPVAAAVPKVDQGFDWDDDVEELDALSSWVAPAALQKKDRMPRNSSRNPVRRMRRFVATASAIL